jgi:hypothetical protein
MVLTELLNRVKNLSLVVQDVEIDLSGKKLNGRQQTELQEIASSCRNILCDLKNIIDDYSDVDVTDENVMKGRIVKRAWKRLKWEPNEIRKLRLRITSIIAFLGTFNGRTMQDSIGKIVRYQDEEEHQALLDWISPSDYGAQQGDYIAQHQQRSGQWLLDSPKFQSWISGSKQTLFCPAFFGVLLPSSKGSNKQTADKYPNRSAISQSSNTAPRAAPRAKTIRSIRASVESRTVGFPEPGKQFWPPL